MKTAAELKRFFKEKLNVTGIRVRTIPCKAKWMQVWIPSERNVGDALVYKQTIPLEFRELCLRIIYPHNLELSKGGNAGNVNGHNISMVPVEWDKALAEWETNHPTA